MTIMAEFKFELGDRAKDSVTGFSGVLTSRTQWITGCNTYGIQSQELRDGKPVDATHFDEERIVILAEAVIAPASADVPPGGPERAVSKPSK
jgi:hypothetical protein